MAENFNRQLTNTVDKILTYIPEMTFASHPDLHDI